MRAMWKLCFWRIACPAALLWPVYVLAQDDADVRSPDRLAADVEAVTRPLADANLLSGVVLIAERDAVVLRSSFGYANWELEVENSVQTRFAIGSISKSFTQHVVASLEREGKLELDDPVEKFIPEFPHWAGSVAPTIDHLLNHRGGVPHRVTNALDETQPIGAAGIVDRVRRAGLLFEPGSARLYSSAGYTSLARVMELAAGETYESLLSQRVFAPAGMSTAIGETGQNLMANRAMPYRLGANGRTMSVKRAAFKNLRYLTGAGAVFATADDVLNYVVALEAGTFGAAAWRELVGDEPDSWHGIYGRTNGYEASVDVLPGEGVVFVFLSNLQSAATGQVRMRIRSIVQGQPPQPVPLPPPVGGEFEDPHSIVGTYGRARVALIDGRLYRGENEFFPVAGARYYIPGSGTFMRFRRDGDGRVDALVSTSADGRESVLPRSVN